MTATTRLTCLSLAACAIAAGSATPAAARAVAVYGDTSDRYETHRYNRYNRPEVYQPGADRTSHYSHDKVWERQKEQRQKTMESDIWKRELGDLIPAGYGTIDPSALSSETKALLAEQKKARDAQLVLQQADRRAAAQEVAANAISPDALTQIKRMTDYVTSLSDARMTVIESREEPVQGAGRVRKQVERVYTMRRPNQLAWSATGVGVSASGAFNGTELQLENNINGRNTTIPISGTLDQLLTTLRDQEKLTLPMADLFASNIYDRLTGEMTTARYMGLHQMDGEICHYVACENGPIQWQMWIASEGNPVPKRVIIRYLNLQGAPRFGAIIKELKPAI
jgi:hypothetical protein